jgi:tetratricopeptide (TPR) repeat protein
LTKRCQVDIIYLAWIIYQKEKLMKAKLLLFGIIVLGFSLCLFAQTADELIAKGDVLYAEMTDMATAQEALEYYRKAMGIAENRYEALWKISRQLYFIGVHNEKKKEKKTIFSQGVYNAERAIELEPEKVDGYYWRGVNNGKFGEAKGILKSLALVKPIKRDMNKVLELDENYKDGGADRVLGRVYFKLPGMAGGSKKKSLEHLERSKELGPEDALTRVYLGETLLAMKEIEKSKEELEYVLNIEDDDRWITDIKESKKTARELLKHKKFRKK